jgi:Domain of unknown function (DUF5679)
MFGRLFWVGLAALLGWVIVRALREQSDPPAAPAGQPPTWTYQPPSAPAAVAEPSAAVPDAALPAAAPAVAEVAPAAPAAAIEIYCVRCKERREVPNAVEERTANGRRAARGICPVCGAKVFTFLREHESTETSA